MLSGAHTLVVCWKWATFSPQSLQMIWEKLQHQSALLQEYRIRDIERVLITKYNPLHRSARLTMDHFHRLIFLDGIGTLSGKTVIKNEYGMAVGHMNYSKSQKNEGNIELDGKIYRFLLTEDRSITVYIKENPELSLISQASFSLQPEPLTQTDICCLAISLCWQLSLPQPVEAASAYAPVLRQFI